MKQTIFDFGFIEQLEESDFIVSGSNRYAFSMIDRWPEWGTWALTIYGPHACGKSHLAQIWRKHTGALLLKRQNLYSQDPTEIASPGDCFIIEDLENIHDEATLLHWYNGLKESGAFLLLTSHIHPSQLAVRLPDLRSRLISTPSVGIERPDEMLLKTLFLKYFSDRQLRVNDVVMDYLIARVERSFLSVRRVVELMDKQAMTQQSAITIPFAKKILALLQTQEI